MALIDGLIAYWELDNTNDSHSNNYHLTNNGSITFVTGKVGNAADLERDTTAQILTITDANGPLLSPANSAYFFAVWIKLESDPGGTQFIAVKDTGSAAEFWLGYQGGLPNVQFTAFGSAGLGNQNDAARSGALTPGTWYLVMAWFDPTTDKVYLQVSADSAYESTVNESAAGLTSGIFETTGALGIGGDVGGAFGPRWFDGLIDQVGVWGRVLDPTERQELYNGGAGLSYSQLTPPAGPSLSWLPSTRVVRGASAIIIPSGFDPGQTVS
jgi:hypothetical protein